MKRPHSKEWEEHRVAAIRKWAKNRVWPKDYKRPIEHTQPMLDALKKAHLENPEKYKLLAISNLPKTLRGDKNPNWKGGITLKTRGLRATQEYENWRKIVLKRCKNKCVDCGVLDNLEVHHISPLVENDEFIFEPANGVVLCVGCHLKIPRGRKGGSFKEMVRILTIPHHWQEYETVGNWKFGRNGGLLVLVSDMQNEKYEFLIGLHEMIEAYLCKKANIKESDVTAFDIEFEKNRPEGNVDEPGNDPKAPYYHQHLFATEVERALAKALSVDWNIYDKFVNEFN